MLIKCSSCHFSKNILTNNISTLTLPRTMLTQPLSKTYVNLLKLHRVVVYNLKIIYNGIIVYPGILKDVKTNITRTQGKHNILAFWSTLSISNLAPISYTTTLIIMTKFAASECFMWLRRIETIDSENDNTSIQESFEINPKMSCGLYYKTITIIIMTIVSDATIWSVTYSHNWWC